jgi:hypothetical protein
LKTLFAALIAFGVGGCSTTIAAHRPLSDPALAEVNQSIEGRAARVVLGEGPEQNADVRRARRSVMREASLDIKEVQVERDTTRWLELRPRAESEWRPTEAPTASLKSITVQNRARGAGEAFLIGFVGGAVVSGFAAGVAAGGASPGEISGCPSFGCSLEFGAVVGLAGGLVAGLLALPIGALIGHTTTIQFDDVTLPGGR